MMDEDFFAGWRHFDFFRWMNGHAMTGRGQKRKRGATQKRTRRFEGSGAKGSRHDDLYTTALATSWATFTGRVSLSEVR